MAAVVPFIGMLLISMVVALLAVLQLGDFFAASGEFGWVVSIVMGSVVVALGVFALTYRLARSASLITWVAWLLALVALAPAALPSLVQRLADLSTNPFTVGVENTYITIELIVPVLLAILVQWGLVRRRWLRSLGHDDLTRWPWITTGLAALILLSPFGLAFLQGTLKHAGGDFMWEFTATVTGVTVGALLVMAWIECYIRDRMLNRRSAGRAPRESGHRTINA